MRLKRKVFSQDATMGRKTYRVTAMSDALEWICREIEILDKSGDADINTGDLNPVPVEIRVCFELYYGYL